MIEIDEATKDIMTELQDGLTKNIESGISNSLQSVMQRQERSIKEIEDILQVQLLNVSSDIESTKKPITRMARDVEHTIKLIENLEKLQKVQAEQLMNVRQQQMDSIQQLIDKMIHELAKTQEAELAKSIQLFEVKTGEAALVLISNIKEVQQQFSRITEKTQANLVQQYEQFIELNEQLAENQQHLQQEINTLKNTIAVQETKFEQMNTDLTQHSKAFSYSLQQSFDAHTTALSKQHEQQTAQLTSDVKQQVTAMEGVAERLISSNEQTTQQLNSQLVDSVKMMEQQILHSIVNNKGFDVMQEKLTALETTLTSTIKEQALVEKLATIEKDLAYARLPFYKKWFTKREDF